ncbi:hypothetical protein, partial [uncultured Gimesia sp.]|uniref:hypothetical protein n=1 Tax=uncultured Gimesia sp. TaxID=1678688 RepID=UPI0026125A73
MNSTDALLQALMIMINAAFPLEEISEFNDSRDSLETDSLNQYIVGKNWQEIDPAELITRSFTVNYLGPQSAASLLPAL